MSSADSVTHWIRQLKAADPAAAQRLWQRYVGRLVGLARQKLGGLPRRATDEEDVVQSAFDSFFRGVAGGRFPLLADRDNLWPLLVLITARKAADVKQSERRLKRGGGRVRGESVLLAPGGEGDPERGLEQLAGAEPTPEFAALAAEEFGRLLELLGQDQLRAVALWKMEGYSNDEIAAKLGRSRGTVERKLRLIRDIWERDGRP
jgi:DNA-directed RNA polymerase specialized sigma24 family protein